MDDFTGNRYWQAGQSVDYPKQATPIDPSDHPSTSMPTATEDHSGTVLGTDTLKRAFKLNKALGGAAQNIEMNASQDIASAVRGQ